MSTLIGFLCHEEAEWVDLRKRVGEVYFACFVPHIFLSHSHLRLVSSVALPAFILALSSPFPFLFFHWTA
jgi:hypothetical protein